MCMCAYVEARIDSLSLSLSLSLPPSLPLSRSLARSLSLARARALSLCSCRPAHACVNSAADLVHSLNTGPFGGGDKTCSTPYEDWEGPFMQCALDNADPMLINWLRKNLGARARESVWVCT